MNRNADIFEEVVRLRREGIPAALATIVGTRGSTPGRTTMRLLVLEDGTFLGTVGGGHVSKALCQVAALAGFRVTVVDDRADFATKQRFPEASETLCAPLPQAVAAMPLRANSYVVVVTRGHKEDGIVLEALAQRFVQGARARFLGMIGSRTKQVVLFRHLREAGVSNEFLDTVRTPMGAYIGARSHEEIAVSVVAELVAVRRLNSDLASTWAAKTKSKPQNVVKDLSVESAKDVDGACER